MIMYTEFFTLSPGSKQVSLLKRETTQVSGKTFGRFLLCESLVQLFWFVKSDVTPFTVSVCAQSVSQLLTHCRTGLCSCELDMVFTRRLREMVSKLCWSPKELHLLASLDQLGGLHYDKRKSGSIGKTFPSWTHSGCDHCLEMLVAIARIMDSYVVCNPAES